MTSHFKFKEVLYMYISTSCIHDKSMTLRILYHWARLFLKSLLELSCPMIYFFVVDTDKMKIDNKSVFVSQT